MAEHPVLAWLEAELARVEAAARAAGGGGIEAVDYLWGTKYLDVRQPDGEAKQTTEFSAELADHFATNSPAAVLRRVAADRQILAEHQPTWSTGEPEYDYHREPVVGENGRTRYVEVINDDPIPPYWCGCCQAEAPCRTVRLLAEAYGWTEETHA